MPSLPSASPEQSARLLRVSTAIARASASILSLDELLQRVTTIVCEELALPFAGVFLIDESGQWAELVAAYGDAGQRMVKEGFKLSVGGNSLVGMATRLHQARVVTDIDQEADFVRNPHLHLPNAHAELALPILSGDQILGAFSVQSDRALQAFTQEDVALAQGVAAEVAVAVRNATLYHQNQDLQHQSDRRAHLFEAASKVSKQVTSILSLDDLLPRAVDIICEAYGFYYAGVFLIDETGKEALLVAGRGEPGRILLYQKHKLAVGGPSMIGMATSLGEARIALDVGDERVHFKNPVLPFTRSEMALPLRVGKKILGAVTVQSIEEDAFSQDDILTLQTMVDQLAIAINNARLLKELDLAHRELLRTKTYEALTSATTAAIHWIGNKALPITTTAARLQSDLDQGIFDPTSFGEDLAMMDENARLIVAVKENLLGPAREQTPRPALLSDVAQAAAYFSEVPSAMLTIAAVQDEPLALADTQQIARVLSNLYRNSLEAGAKHILVQVAPAEGDSLNLRVTDDGPGIPAEMLEKMWAPFVSSKGPDHNGLGLTAAQHIITQMQGRITAASQPGKGASFDITLPTAAKADAPAPAKSGATGPGILLIDDEDAWAVFATQVFREAGIPCQRASDLAGIDLTAPGLILVDEALESASLTEVLNTLQAAGAAPRTLLITPAPAAERAAAQLKHGLKDIALKPYTAPELVSLIG